MNEVRQRIQAVQRFLTGEKPEAISASVGRSRAWLYKSISRYDENNNSWCENRPTVLSNAANRTPIEIEEIVKMISLNLYNQDLFFGVQTILWELEDLGVKPLPSLSNGSGRAVLPYWPSALSARSGCSNAAFAGSTARS